MEKKTKETKPVVSIRHAKKYFLAGRHLFRPSDYVKAVDDESYKEAMIELGGAN